MKALLGFLLLSVLLTSGYCLECETCAAQAATCSGDKVKCLAGQDACLSAVNEITVGSTKVTSVVKSCFQKAACRDLKPGASASFGSAGAVIKSFECSRAPISSGSFLLALSSLLFLKLLW